MGISEALASFHRLDFSFLGKWEPVRFKRGWESLSPGATFQTGNRPLWAWLRADPARSPYQCFGPRWCR